MKAGKSRSLRDVDEQTRSAVLKAAQKSGLTVDEWLGMQGGPPAVPGSSAFAPPPRQAAGAADSGDPSQAVREAIGRLTARLSVMDEKARASVAGLTTRLADIEDRLAFLVEAKQKPDDR